jgi:hypothetical protein
VVSGHAVTLHCIYFFLMIYEYRMHVPGPDVCISMTKTKSVRGSTGLGFVNYAMSCIGIIVFITYLISFAGLKQELKS